MNAYPLSRLVRRDEVPDDGLELDIDATAEERKAMAKLLDIPAVESLSGHLQVTRWRGRGLAVKGEAEARVEQTCVVTLDPVTNTVREEIEVYFAPEGGARSEEAKPAGELEERDIEDLVGDSVDVGALVAEHVALGLDPYPRKPGAVFEQGDLRSPDTEKGAFAALSVLKGGRGAE